MSLSNGAELVELVRKSELVDAARLDPFLKRLQKAGKLDQDPKQLACRFVQDGLLTHFQAKQLLQGKWKGFNFGKYRVLERLGHGSNSSVYLCEHLLMRRRVSVKVLPVVEAQNPAALE